MTDDRSIFRPFSVRSRKFYREGPKSASTKHLRTFVRSGPSLRGLCKWCMTEKTGFARRTAEATVEASHVPCQRLQCHSSIVKVTRMSRLSNHPHICLCSASGEIARERRGKTRPMSSSWSYQYYSKETRLKLPNSARQGDRTQVLSLRKRLKPWRVRVRVRFRFRHGDGPRRSSALGSAQHSIWQTFHHFHHDTSSPLSSRQLQVRHA